MAFWQSRSWRARALTGGVRALRAADAGVEDLRVGVAGGRPGIDGRVLFVTELQTSAWPISCCISTPPSSAAHGTWFCCLAVLYSAWKVNGVP